MQEALDFIHACFRVLGSDLLPGDIARQLVESEGYLQSLLPAHLSIQVDLSVQSGFRLHAAIVATGHRLCKLAILEGYGACARHCGQGGKALQVRPSSAVGSSPQASKGSLGWAFPRNR